MVSETCNYEIQHTTNPVITRQSASRECQNFLGTDHILSQSLQVTEGHRLCAPTNKKFVEEQENDLNVQSRLDRLHTPTNKSRKGVVHLKGWK